MAQHRSQIQALAFWARRSKLWLACLRSNDRYEPSNTNGTIITLTKGRWLNTNAMIVDLGISLVATITESFTTKVCTTVQ
jgi:hypothetical protein